MIKTENKLVSISNIDELRKRRDLASLDKIVELVSENLRKIDNLEINNYDKNLFEEIIFDFIFQFSSKNKRKCPVSLLMKCVSMTSSNSIMSFFKVSSFQTLYKFA